MARDRGRENIRTQLVRAEPAEGSNRLHPQRGYPVIAPLVDGLPADAEGSGQRPRAPGTTDRNAGSVLHREGSLAHGQGVEGLHQGRNGFLHRVQRHCIAIRAMLLAALSTTDHQKAMGARLRLAIDLADITYVEAARIMGITKHVLNHWMQGNNPPQPTELYRLHRVTGIDANWVILGDFSALPHRLAVSLAESEGGAVAPQSRPADASAPVRKSAAPGAPSRRTPRKGKTKV